MRRPGISLRLRLALSYAVFVVLVGVVVIAIGYLVVRFIPEEYGYGMSGGFIPNRRDLLEVYLRYSFWGIAGLGVLGTVGGWLLAGWMLRPLTRIEKVVAQTTGGASGERIRLPGGRTELTELADAFDRMLDRVEHSVAAERRLAANASHELRTPLAVTRTLLQVARADPEGHSVRVTRLLERLAATNDRSIAMTEGTLALTRIDHETLRHDAVDLGAVIATVVDDLDGQTTARAIAVSTRLAPVTVTGHATLLMQLVDNLLVNAVVHNVDDGTIDVSLAPRAGGAVLTVENSGPPLDPDTVDTLTEPFVRGSGRTRRPGDRQSVGLGLAIVRSIVDAHSGTLTLAPLPGGGLRVTVELPAH